MFHSNRSLVFSTVTGLGLLLAALLAVGCEYHRSFSDEVAPLPNGGQRTTHTEELRLFPQVLPNIPGIIQFTPLPQQSQPQPVQPVVPATPPATPETTPRNSDKEPTVGVGPDGELLLALGNRFYSLSAASGFPDSYMYGGASTFYFGGFGSRMQVTISGPAPIGLQDEQVVDEVDYQYDPESGKESITAELPYLLGLAYIRGQMILGQPGGVFFAQIVEFKVPAAADRRLPSYLVLAHVCDGITGREQWVPVLNPYRSR